jgi:hypothetical protein
MENERLEFRVQSLAFSVGFWFLVSGYPSASSVDEFWIVVLTNYIYPQITQITRMDNQKPGARNQEPTLNSELLTSNVRFFFLPFALCPLRDHTVDKNYAFVRVKNDRQNDTSLQYRRTAWRRRDG